MPKQILPLVDISRLESDSFEDRLSVARELDRACVEAGFLYISGSQFDGALFRRLLERAKLYFALDQQTKMQAYIGLSENHSGYVPVGEEQFGVGTADLKEAFDVNNDYPDFTGTPGFVINGKLVDGAASWDKLKPALDAAVKG